MEPVETFEDRGYKAHIFYDDDPQNPRKEFDCYVGHMVCWHRRSDLGDETIDTGQFEDMAEMIASFGDLYAILPLYLYEHSGMTMSCGSSTDAGNPFHDRWDSGQVGWIYTTKERLAELGWTAKDLPSVDKIVEFMQGEVAEYDAYLTGQCFGYAIESPTGELEGMDSCWGYYGIESVTEEAKSSLKWEADRTPTLFDQEVSA